MAASLLLHFLLAVYLAPFGRKKVQFRLQNFFFPQHNGIHAKMMPKSLLKISGQTFLRYEACMGSISTGLACTKYALFEAQAALAVFSRKDESNVEKIPEISASMSQ
jgi:hypothetical protein